MLSPEHQKHGNSVPRLMGCIHDGGLLLVPETLLIVRAVRLQEKLKKENSCLTPTSKKLALSLVYRNHNCKLSGVSHFFILLYSSDAADLKHAATSLDYNRRN